MAIVEINLQTNERIEREYTVEEIEQIAQRQPSAEELANLNKLYRTIAYREESDPIFFKAQRGEATLDDWKAKVAEIKARYPE